MKAEIRLKTHSFRSNLILRCALLILMMTVAMGILFGEMRRENSSILQMLEYEMVYNDYFSGISDLRSQMLTYMNTSSAEDGASCRDAAEKCRQQAEQLAEYYRHPQFEDQKYMAASLVGAVEKFVSSREDEISKAYESAGHVISLILDSEQLLSRTERDLVNQNMEIFHGQENIRTVLLLLLIGAAFGSGVWLSFRIADRMVSPIERLTSQVRQAETEFLSFTPDGREDAVTSEELVLLSRSFYSMIHTLQEQTRAQNEQIEMERRLEELKFQNMQMKVYLAQSKLCITQALIHPHFLFNCLNTISSMEYLEGAVKSRKITQLIATFLRDALSRVGSIVCVREELESIQRYVDIQKLRYGERIACKMEVQELCLEARIPAMALQPIIENAYVHGVGDRKEDGLITIQIKEKQGRIFVNIFDNGRGLTQERIAEIKRLLEKETFEEGNRCIGLRSTIVLLKSCFRGDVGFNLASVPGQYTSVDLNFPLFLRERQE